MMLRELRGTMNELEQTALRVREHIVRMSYIETLEKTGFTRQAAEAEADRVVIHARKALDQ